METGELHRSVSGRGGSGRDKEQRLWNSIHPVGGERAKKRRIWTTATKLMISRDHSRLQSTVSASKCGASDCASQVQRSSAGDARKGCEHLKRKNCAKEKRATSKEGSG